MKQKQNRDYAPFLWLILIGHIVICIVFKIDVTFSIIGGIGLFLLIREIIFGIWNDRYMKEKLEEMKNETR